MGERGYRQENIWKWVFCGSSFGQGLTLKLWVEQMRYSCTVIWAELRLALPVSNKGEYEAYGIQRMSFVFIKNTKICVSAFS